MDFLGNVWVLVGIRAAIVCVGPLALVGIVLFALKHSSGKVHGNWWAQRTKPEGHLTKGKRRPVKLEDEGLER